MDRVVLLEEQARLVARLAEITRQLQGQSSTGPRPRPCEQLGIKAEVHAMAILLTEPEIDPQSLADRVGVSRGSLYRWPTVGRTLRAREE